MAGLGKPPQDRQSLRSQHITTMHETPLQRYLMGAYRREMKWLDRNVVLVEEWLSGT